MPKVLVVEDNVDLCRMYERLFIFRKYEVEIAYNGKEGLEKVKSFKPDVVLLDIMMPEMSGTEVLRTLKSNPETSKIPVVIMLTNIDQDETVKETLDLGAVSYMVKSDFTPSEVIEEVQKYLPRPA